MNKRAIAALAAVLLMAGATAAKAEGAPQDLIKKARCVACHAVDAKRVGPAYRDVAAHYKGQEGAADTLFAKVRHGGSGVWGPVPMTPNGTDKISDEDLKAVVAWILAGAE